MANTSLSQLASATVPLAGTELTEVSQLDGSITYTGTNVSASAADNSINRATGDFIALGFAVGQRIKISGFSNSANNILGAYITAISGTKITIGGTDGDAIVNESAGNSVTITKWTSKRTTVKDLGAGSNTSYVASKSISTSSGVAALTLDTDSTFDLTLTENLTTLNITGVQSGKVNFFTLRVKQDSTGGWTFDPPASWKYANGGAAYIVSDAPDAIDLIQGVSYDNGTTWLITYALDFQ